jgi:hypothetical protein
MRRRKPTPLYEPTLKAAAKLVAAHRGHYGKAGGWIYDAQDRPICQGWTDYGNRLLARNVIAPKEVVNPDPDGPAKVVRFAINWRRLERPL